MGASKPWPRGNRSVGTAGLSGRPVVTPAQCRAARALLKWTQAKLALEAGVARKTIADFENGGRTLHRRTRADVAAALEKGGVAFLSTSADSGEGVCRVTPAAVVGEVPHG